METLYLGSNIKVIDKSTKTTMIAKNTTITGILNAVNDTDVVAYNQLKDVKYTLNISIIDLSTKIKSLEIKDDAIDKQVADLENKIKCLETTNVALDKKIADLNQLYSQQNDRVNTLNESLLNLTQHFFKMMCPKIK